MDRLEKEKRRKAKKTSMQKRVNKTINNLWTLLMKELEIAKNKYNNDSDLAAELGVNVSQINKWLDGQGKERFLVESCLKLINGLDISMARVLMAISPRRAKILTGFSNFTGSEFDKLAALNKDQQFVLKSIILGYLQSIPSPSRNSETNNIK